MIRFPIHFIWVLISFCVVPAYGRQSKGIEINLSSASFSELVQAIEHQTNYTFFFEPAWTDSLVLNVRIQNADINQALDKALEATGLSYSIYTNTIFITKDRKIFNTLPVDFFNEKKSISKTGDFDYSDYEQWEMRAKKKEEKLYSIGKKNSNLQGNATLNGFIKDIKTGEIIIGASVFVENPILGTSSDQWGAYSFTLPKGKHKLIIKSIGMKNTQRQIILYEDGKFDIEMEEDITPLKEVVVHSERDAKVTSTRMGVERLDIKAMKQMPLALGETDVMKIVLTLPGVQSVGEGTSGINVRGGASNQNLLLFNGATVYNPSHLFGFFSTFNPDVLKSVELYKSGITADYGGRLSSVLDVQTREGNQKKISVSGGLSPITGRLTVEGPIIKNRTSFIIGARSTYSDWILKRLNNPNLNESTASFNDFTAIFNHKINDNNQLSFSGYLSQDNFRLGSDTSYYYSDRNIGLKWKHVFTRRFHGVFSSTLSQYNYSIKSDRNPVNSFEMNFAIRQLNGKVDFNYVVNGKHTLHFGVSSINYNLSPGTLTPRGEESLVEEDGLENEKGLESAIYIGDHFELNNKFSLYVGIRYSFYQFIGPKEIYQYAKELPLQEITITDTLHYNKGKVISNYHGFEPRITARYLLTDYSSVKFSYNKMRQYIQMLSNTAAIAPTDIWKLSDPYIQPQSGDQISLGYYQNMKNSTIETSVEAYYKRMDNLIDYKDGAVLLLNKHIETDVLNTRGTAYGVEFMVKKSSGKLNGWISYTYSRSLLQTKSNRATEIINRGAYYPSSYDKPHAINFIGNYRLSRRFNFSLNLIYGSGRPITLPIAKYGLGSNTRIFYSDRNSYRIPDYFRSDISINLEGNHKIKKLAHSSWTFSVYNLTGRKNAYSVFFVSQNGVINGYKLSVFGQPIPTITYNFKF